MSVPDAELTAQEKAALAHLEAAAVADDPHLAARLKGTPRSQIKVVPPRLGSYLIGRWRSLLRAGWWGAPLAAAGFAMMVLGLSAGIVLSLAGAVVSAVGLRILAALVEARLRDLRAAQERQAV